jgi:hypothetical protein
MKDGLNALLDDKKETKKDEPIKKKQFNIVGEWSGKTNTGEDVSVIFKANGSFNYIFGNTVFGCSDMEKKGEKQFGEPNSCEI